MAKSAILKDLVNNTISLEIALSRLLVISNDLGNTELYEWAENELTGYSDKDTLPSYRIKRSLHLRYSGINGSFQVTNVPLDTNIFSKEEKDDLSTINVFEGIKVLEDLSALDNDIIIDLSNLAGIVYKRSGGIQCYSIQQLVPKGIYKEILNQIRSTLIKIYINLDKEYGNLDELDIDMANKDEEDIKAFNKEIALYIYNDNSTKLGDNNKVKKSFIGRRK